MNASTYRLFWAMLALQVPAVSVVIKYAPEELRSLEAPALFVVCILGFLVLRRPAAWKDRLLGSWQVTIGLILAMLVATAAIYPYADGLKEIGGGSDADDAVILGVTRLFQGLYPYDIVTYSGHLLSPGPGWLLLWAPLVLLDLFWLAGPLSVGFLAWSLQRSTGSWTSPNALLLLLSSSLCLWEGLVTGSDYLMIGSMCAGLVLVLWSAQSRRLVLILAALLGLVATSRVVFLYLPAAAAVALWPRSKENARLVAIVGTAIAVVTHGLFLLWQPESFSPLHVIGMGGDYTTPWIRWFGVIACLGVAVWILRHLRTGASDPAACVERLWPTLLVPMAIIALGGLELVDWSVRQWWTSRSLMIAAPVVVACWALGTSSPSERVRPS